MILEFLFLNSSLLSLFLGEWKQPPHFRAQMDPKLQRQIAKKWGDRALELPQAGHGGELYRVGRERREARLCAS